VIFAGKHKQKEDCTLRIQIGFILDELSEYF